MSDAAKWKQAGFKMNGRECVECGTAWSLDINHEHHDIDYCLGNLLVALHQFDEPSRDVSESMGMDTMGAVTLLEAMADKGLYEFSEYAFNGRLTDKGRKKAQELIADE